MCVKPFYYNDLFDYMVKPFSYEVIFECALSLSLKKAYSNVCEAFLL